jgi:hypothetical protein
MATDGFPPSNSSQDDAMKTPCDLTKLVSECSSSEKTTLLVELIRDLLRGLGDFKQLEIRDRTGTVLGHFLPAGVHFTLEESPAFLDELDRRLESPEQPLSPETVLALLKGSRSTPIP